jgi:outer membrane protein TolC
MKRIVGILLVIFFPDSFLTAGDMVSLTPEQAVEYALQGNLSLKNEAISLRRAEREYSTSWNTFLPSVKGTGALSYSDRLFTESASGVNAPWNVGFGISASLPLNWSAAPGLESARLQYEAGKISYERARSGIRRDVLKNYYSLVAQETNLGVVKENADLADAILKTVQTKFEKGLAPETDLLEARVNAGRLKNTYLNSKAAYENNLMSFLTLLGLAPDTEVRLTGTMTVPTVSVDGDKALSLVLQSAELQVLLLNVRILEKSKEAAIGGYLTPTLSLGLGWEDSASPPFASGDWRDALSLSFTLSVPLDGLIPGSADRNAVDALGDSVEASRNSYQLAVENKRTTVKGLLHSIDNAERSSDLSLENRKFAQQSLDLSREAWRAGTRSLLEMQTSQTNLLSASQDYLSSLFSWISYLLDLEYELGTGPDEISAGKGTHP